MSMCALLFLLLSVCFDLYGSPIALFLVFVNWGVVCVVDCVVVSYVVSVVVCLVVSCGFSCVFV